MGWWARQAARTADSFRRVWSSNYPKWLWFVNAAVGILAGTLFAIFGFDGTIGEKAGVGIGSAFLATFICFGFSYGVVRARGSWGSSKRPGTGFGGK